MPTKARLIRSYRRTTPRPGRQGDKNARQALITRFEPCLRVFVRRHLGQPTRRQGDSLDALQEVRLRLHLVDMPESVFESERSFMKYAATVAAHVVRAWDRYLHQERRDIDRHAALPDEAWRSLRAHTPEPQAAPASVWADFVQTLLPACRVIATMSGHGLDTPTIARELGISDVTVRRVLRHVRERFEYELPGVN